VPDLGADLTGDPHTVRTTRSRHRIKKGRFVEQALLHHMQALHELPADVIIRPRLVVTRRSGERIGKRITVPQRPAKRLRALLRGDGN